MPAIRGPDAPSHNGGRSPAYGPPSQGVLDGVRQLVCSDEPVAAAGDGHRPQGQHGTRRNVVSSCTPAESVIAAAAPRTRDMNSR
jgi:hypothetical protein